MIRVVLDTNVLFSAIYTHRGNPAFLIDLVAAGSLTPCVSDAVMEEYEDVLTRPILQPHRVRTRELLRFLTQFAVHVSPGNTLALCSDPDDNRFLECAVAAGAGYLVTGNIRHFPRHYGNVAIVTPRNLLQRLLGTE